MSNSSPDSNVFRFNNSTDLNPLYISLGLQPTAFRTFNPQLRPTFFDTAVNCGPVHPDCIWLFEGSDYHRYNLRERKFELERSPISEFGKFGERGLPSSFFNGVNTVAYGGSAFPDQYFFFCNETYVGLTSNGSVKDTANSVAQWKWTAFEGPRGVLGAFACGAWTNPSGVFLKPGVMVALHGEGPRAGHVHFFRHGEYALSDLVDYATPVTAVPIARAWNLPSPFTENIDLAFYGVGPEAQKIYFFSGLEFVLYDPEYDQVIRSGMIEREFPGFARFLSRPQLFLVENTSLRTYLGPLAHGTLLETQALGPGQSVHRILVIETTDSTATTTQSNVLESQDHGTIENLSNRVDKATSERNGSDSFNYRFNASAHADAEADSFWGGEVNANVSAQGGTDSLRKDFASSVLDAVSNQVTESTSRRESKTYSSREQITHTEKVISISETDQKNDKDYPINVGFFTLLQPYIGLMILNSVRIAYADGYNPRVVDLVDLPQLLDDVLAPGQSKEAILNYVKGELSRISDARNNKVSILSPNAEEPVLLPNLSTKFALIDPDGKTQEIAVPGVVKMMKEWTTQARGMAARII